MGWGAPVMSALRQAAVSAGYGPDGKQFSLLEYMLWETEQMHCKVRRYTSPDEHPFFPHDSPPLILPPIQYPEAGSDPPNPLFAVKSSSADSQFVVKIYSLRSCLNC